jgi:D-threo-aldose 1-dehydrogenase
VDLTSSYRQVGTTAFEVPVFGLGTAHLGELFAPVAEPDSRATLDAAWDGGVRFYDTAPWYGRGLSEHRLGGFLRTKKRAEFVITTKVGRTLHRPNDPQAFDRSPWKGGLNFEVKFDYSYDGIMRSYEQALQRLALDTVDALVIHDLDAGFHGDALEGHKRALSESGMRALGEIKADGQIKAVGVGINTAEALDTMVREYDVDFALVAMPYTLLDQKSLGGGLATCVERKISVIVGAPFASGILVRGSKSDAAYGYATAPEARARKSAADRGGVRCAWRRPAGCGVAIPARPPRRCLHHPRRGAPDRGDPESRFAGRPDPRGFLVGPQGRGAHRGAAPVPAGR